MRTRIVILSVLCGIVLVTVSCSSFTISDKPSIRELERKKKMADTWEKREAIGRMQVLFREYDKNIGAMKCADLILEAGRNADVIAKLAEYAITNDGGTGMYIRLAEYAAVAPVADYEFIEMAELLRTSGTARIDRLAREASRARSESELVEVRSKMNELMSER